MSFKNLRINYNGGKYTLPIWAKKLVEAGQLGVNKAASNNCLHLVISLPAISYASSFIAMGVVAECLGSSENNDDEQTNDIEYWRSKIGQGCHYTNDTGITTHAEIESIEEIDGEELIKIKVDQKKKGHVRTKWEFLHPVEASNRIQLTNTTALK